MPRYQYSGYWLRQVVLRDEVGDRPRRTRHRAADAAPAISITSRSPEGSRRARSGRQLVHLREQRAGDARHRREIV